MRTTTSRSGMPTLRELYLLSGNAWLNYVDEELHAHCEMGNVGLISVIPYLRRFDDLAPVR
jgi:hypothetical protein